MAILDDQTSPSPSVFTYPAPPPQQADGRVNWAEEGQIIGNYRLVRRVGGGGFGEVYEARHVTLQNAFAVKLLQPQWAKDEKFHERFQQEAYVTAELRHENVVQVIDFGVSEKVGPYLICEWLEGKSLYRLWRLNRNLKWGWIYALFSQLLDALSYAHERGIVHRDLKPENMILTMGSRNRLLIKIVDFGIARMVGQHLQQRLEDDQLSKRGAAIGTPFYMSPEQVRGEMERIDHRTDLYACGIILAELLTGHRVFDGPTNRDIMRLHLEAHPPRLCELNPEREYPEVLEALIAKALAKEPQDRFQHANDFYEALQHAMRSIGIEAIREDIYHDTGEATGMYPMPKRHVVEYKMLNPPTPPSKRLRSLFFGALLSILLLGGLLFALTPPPPPPKTKPKTSKAAWIDEPKPPPAPKLTVQQQALPTPPPDTDPTEELPQPRKRKTSKRKKTAQQRRKARLASRRPLSRRPDERKPDERKPNERKPDERRPTPPRLTQKEPLISYRIETTPAGATVLVDGKKRGVTPLTLREEKGKRLQIDIKLKDHVPKAYLWVVKDPKKDRFRLIEEL